MSHFLQSSEWAAFQQQMGRPTLTRRGSGWEYMAVYEQGRLNTRLYVPYGPTFADQASLRAALYDLRAVGRRLGVTLIRVEPTSPSARPLLKRLGFVRRSRGDIQPQITRVIDLSPTEEQIIAQMKKNTRPRVRNYKKKNIRIRKSSDPQEVEILFGLLEAVSERNDVTLHSKDYYRTLAEALLPLGSAALFIAEVEGQPVAASLAFDSSDTRIYAHTAADDNYRRLHVGTALVGAMIMDAKRAGLTHFDLFGITDSDDPDHPWAGFTKFKEDFGGEVVEYAGTWELPLNKVTYAVVDWGLKVLRRLAGK